MEINNLLDIIQPQPRHISICQPIRNGFWVLSSRWTGQVLYIEETRTGFANTIETRFLDGEFTSYEIGQLLGGN